ncbi:hypothetical protein [Janthinobacterium sp. SUN137]|uniref:hypothetical protein n=1 Tax=Janthinobacterium sp. SUN137 TaxID=3014789 RepID=UPI002712FC89|nr:hypothetical protein [Janthinobacterium sp. SUN137]MDO8039477.1 hypothetical protein [Janthinobacterium sp. SUN137]
MSDPRMHPMWGVCDQIGLAEARHRLFTENHVATRQIISAWIESAEREERAMAEQRQEALNERSVRAAEASAASAAQSEKTSAASARASIFAAVVSFFALLVAAAAYLKS